MRDIIVLSRNTFKRLVMSTPGMGADQHEYLTEKVEFRIDGEMPNPFINIIADYGGVLCLQVADLDNPGTPQGLLATVKELMR